MNRLEFETKLNEAYNGAVVPLNKYVNKNAVICFKCNECGVKFFGKPSHIVGKDHQRHACNMPYGTTKGERTSSISSIKKTTNKTKGIKLDMDIVNKMIWEDYTYQQIASEFKVNPNIIKEYFEQVGLI